MGAAQGGGTQEPPDGSKPTGSSAIDAAHPSGAELEALKAKAELYDAQRAEMAELKDLVKRVAEKEPTAIHTWNVNIFLETHCNNAMNIADFVERLKLTQKDLLYTGQNGYVEGMSQVFIKGLKELTPAQRPIHCASKPRSLYIRDDGRWECDGDGRLLGSQLSAMSKKHVDVLRAWEREHPDWKQSEVQTKTYMQLVQQALGGSSDAELSRNCKQIGRRIALAAPLEDVVE